MGQVAGLPAEMGQFCTEIHRVLSGATPDFQHPRAIGKHLAQHFQDGLAVLGAGFGEGFVGQSILPSDFLHSHL